MSNIQFVGKLTDNKFFCSLMNVSKDSVFSLYYAAPISFYSHLIQKEHITFDLGEHFRKGSYRNRCCIAGANGKLTLSIQLKKGKNQSTPMKDVRICYDHPWQKNHWDSLCSAYRRSPFFEYYEDEFSGFYKNNYEKLADFNLSIHETIMRLLRADVKTSLSENYILPSDDWSDYRKLYETQNHYPTPRYLQVFEDRNGFLEDLSILDLLFNKGNKSLEYLLSINL